jgi:hypothetical protein
LKEVGMKAILQFSMWRSKLLVYEAS